ncbi:shikimate kinase [Phaeacidiphilus oryzae]|uniref:shikimate kinase n=1 Tax=Phaeacidiphilus oryzae TaxID=348818 RepID=UPI0005663C88|nr:shikimate kinase [Phaeacidiphilus oryzae]
MAGPLVILCGPMGVGKSTIGTLLAERLGVAYRDTDADVEAAEGRPISEIFIDEGEDHFREVEARAVAAALVEHDGVLALGGGAVLREETRQRLAGQPVVFLSMGVDEAVHRLHLDRSRPLLMGNPRRKWRELMEARRPIYTSIARVVIDTDARQPYEVVEDVLQALELKDS